jgi:hypothetical protein
MNQWLTSGNFPGAESRKADGKRKYVGKGRKYKKIKIE